MSPSTLVRTASASFSFAPARQRDGADDLLNSDLKIDLLNSDLKIDLIPTGCEFSGDPAIE